jgi:hypothetical protein
MNHACPCDIIVIDLPSAVDSVFLSSKLLIGKDMTISGSGTAQTFLVSALGTPPVRVQPGIECHLRDLTIVDTAPVAPNAIIENTGSLKLSGVNIISANDTPFSSKGATLIIGPGITVLE